MTEAQGYISHHGRGDHFDVSVVEFLLSAFVAWPHLVEAGFYFRSSVVHVIVIRDVSYTSCGNRLIPQARTCFSTLPILPRNPRLPPWLPDSPCMKTDDEGVVITADCWKHADQWQYMTACEILWGYY